MILKPTAIDTIIQSSTVELLHSYELPVAPRGRSEVKGHAPGNDLVGVIDFEGPQLAGRLTLSMPSAVFTMPRARRAPNTTLSDWTRELTNQLMGRIKNRLLQFQVKLRTHLPTVLSAAALQVQNRTRTEILYSFGSLRGEVHVTVDASLASAVLEYSNASVLVPEGELILFD
jgi:chemotaxis phosphatase CheX-like protein